MQVRKEEGKTQQGPMHYAMKSCYLSVKNKGKSKRSANNSCNCTIGIVAELSDFTL